MAEQSEKTLQSKEKGHLLYQNGCIIDVTYYDAEKPGDPFGYMSEGVIQLFSDGRIVVYNLIDRRVLEDFNVINLFVANNNINNYDPRYRTHVAFSINTKGIHIIFQSIEIKKEFWDVFTLVFRNLRR